jgi:hypothetical protein
MCRKASRDFDFRRPVRFRIALAVSFVLSLAVQNSCILFASEARVPRVPQQGVDDAGRQQATETPNPFIPPGPPDALQGSPAPLDFFQHSWHDTYVEYLSSVFRHSSLHPRFLGPGEPLISTSWRNRPVHAGWYVGILFPDDLVQGHVAQDESLFGGYRVGWDFDHYWGSEWRIGWSRPELTSLQGFEYERTGRLMVTDLDVLYYPWGDSKIRPYAVVGMGITEADFRDDLGIRRDETLFSIPFGGGVKHHYRRWLSWRLELMDNFAVGGGSASAMNSVSLTFGVEVHFGVHPRSYYPWNPSRHIW